MYQRKVVEKIKTCILGSKTLLQVVSFLG